MSLFSLFKRSREANPVKLESFSCSGITGFHFNFPLHEGWHVQSTAKMHSTDQYCRIVINTSNTNGTPLKLSINKTPRMEGERRVTLHTNKNGVQYFIASDLNASTSLTDPVSFVGFRTSAFTVEIKLEEINSISTSGFSREKFLATIIESFIVNDN